MLRDYGYETMPVATAADALAFAPRADVVVTGLLLPGPMDGIALITELKRDRQRSDIPVIVLSACTWPSDRNRAASAGCDAFLPKPCLPGVLASQIQRTLALSRASRPQSAMRRLPKSRVRLASARRPAS